MRLTISKKSQNTSKTGIQIKKKPDTDPSILNTSKIETQIIKFQHNHSTQLPTTRSCCNEGIFQKCFDQNKNHMRDLQCQNILLAPLQVKPLRVFNQTPNQRRFIEISKQNLKTGIQTSKDTQSQQKLSNYLANSQKSRKSIQNNLKMQHGFNIQQKQDQIDESKRFTSYTSCQYSMRSTLKNQPIPLIKQQVKAQQKGRNGQGFEQKKINLTMSKSKRQFQNILLFSDNKISQDYDKSNTHVDIQAIERQNLIKKDQSRQNFMSRDIINQSSSNQLRITDPLDQLLSVNTQYLKKKIAFSQVRSERQTVNSYLYQPMIVFGSDKPNQKLNTSNRSSDNGIEIQHRHLFSSMQIKLAQSFVLQRGIQNIFEISSKKQLKNNQCVDINGSISSMFRKKHQPFEDQYLNSISKAFARKDKVSE